MSSPLVFDHCLFPDGSQVDSWCLFQFLRYSLLHCKFAREKVNHEARLKTNVFPLEHDDEWLL